MTDSTLLNAVHASISETPVSHRPGIGPSFLTPMVKNGRLQLSAETLRTLRHRNCLSQEEVAIECAARRIRISIASLKRAETGKPVLYRTARELAKFYQVPVERLFA